jgi:hypothetical protein
LLGHYAEHKFTLKDECFDRCDADPRCAAACFTQPQQCRFFKYGFERANGISGATAYVKPLVSEALADEHKLTEMYTVVKNKKLRNPYDTIDTLTLAQCFKLCKSSRMCGGASFTSDPKWMNNCFLFKSANVTESEDRDGDFYWTSYIKKKA